MKLEEGMYVRTKQGTIEKVIKRYDTLSGCKVEVNEDFRFKHYEHNYIKHIKNASYSLLDLIQIGDYVNGFPVIHNAKEHGGNIVIVINGNAYNEENIKTILTKEQYENNCYKVEE